MYIDTHSHIYSDEFSSDRHEMLVRAAEKEVTVILMPAIDSATHTGMLQLEKEATIQCLAMIGLHPCSVKADYKKELEIVEDYLSRRPFVAIGETGLDFYWDLTFKTQQYIAFERQIEWAVQYNIPVVIHSRNATKECIKVVSKYVHEGLQGVFHCFGGSEGEARAIMELGFYLGIGGVLTFKKSGLDQVIKEVGLERVILETDAPYLAPVPYRGKRNEPSYIPLIAQQLAGTMEMSLEAIAAITTQNAQKLFGL
ncbi:MAG: TatD family hydrolase [Niabella sp.]